MKSTLIQGGWLVTMNGAFDHFAGDLRLQNGAITDIGVRLKRRPEDEVVSASGRFVIPGLIQAHTHLCQALFRGLADDLQLLDWLTHRICHSKTRITKPVCVPRRKSGFWKCSCHGHIGHGHCTPTLEVVFAEQP